MFHHVNNKDKDPYIEPEKLAEDNSKQDYKPSFQNYQNAPRTGLNQTAVQDYVGVGEREIAAETANENSEDFYDEQTNPHEETKTTIKDVKNKEAEKMNNAEQKDNNQENNQQSRVDIPGGNFQQRPGIPAQAARPAYPGAYAGAPQAANTSAYNSNAQSQASDNDNKLVIGSGINLSGEIEACDHLIVQGTVEASLKGAQVLDIAEQGAFYGTVEIENANIAGRFEGDITVRGRLTVESTGIIVGSISYKELSIEAGATIDGAISPIGSENASSRKAPSVPSRSKKVTKSDEAQLPFADKKIAAE